MQADDPVLRNWRPVWFWDVPAPAPPPKLTARWADVHAGTPDETLLVPAVPELVALELAPKLAALELAPPELAPAAGLEELDELAPAAPVDAVDPPGVDDEAAQPAARSPALSSGTASNAFFTTFSLCQR